MSGPLAGPLSFLLPDPAESALLTVCLRPDRARGAWTEWTRVGGDLDRYRSLLPLVDAGIRAAGLEVDAALGARLAGARLHESLRWNAVRDVAADALGRLANAGLDPVVAQDVALAATAYPVPALRHCHGLEVLLPPGEMAAGARCLAAAGLLPEPAGTSAGGARLVHRNGLPVRLAAELFPQSGARGDAEPLRTRAVRADIGVAARVLAPADALALLLGRAATGAERRSLLWACDAAAVIGSTTPFDWERVVDSATRWRLGLPIARMAEWLAAELDIPVPPDAIAKMATVRGGRGTRGATEIALDCARADGRAGTLGLLARAESWRERASVLRWTALPSVGRARRSYPRVPGAALPLLYLARPVLAALRAARRRRGARAGAPGSRVPAGGTAAGRSGDPAGPEAGRPSASPRSSG